MELCTIGHSTRSIEEFQQILLEADVQVVVDVRRLPGSRRHPQFDEDALRDSLAASDIELSRLPELTGRRPVSRTVPFEVNAYWQNRSFHNYADHALSDGFRTDLARLRTLGQERRTAFMCSEAVWWRCHRRIIADHLLAAGDEVTHLMSVGRSEPARLTEGAVIGDDGVVRYPPPDAAG